MTAKIVVLPGDGIGPEITTVALAVLEKVSADYDFHYTVESALIGGAAIEKHGQPYPVQTQAKAKEADALLLGAVGGPQWDHLSLADRPEKGLLAIRQDLQLFANLRPARLFPALVDASSLKPELVSNLDIMIVRELTSGIYFGQPRAITESAQGREAYNTMRYTESEIRRVAQVAFELAAKRQGRLLSVDKANVLEVSQLWREVMESVARDYPAVTLSHQYVDNAAMQLVREPKQFDVMVTSNLFGDILSDCAAMLTGSIGMLPSASLGENQRGLYEPVHGSAPDIAGQNIANPLAMVLSVAMMCQASFGRNDMASAIEGAVADFLAAGHRTADLASDKGTALSTTEVQEILLEILSQ